MVLGGGGIRNPEALLGPGSAAVHPTPCPTALLRNPPAHVTVTRGTVSLTSPPR